MKGALKNIFKKETTTTFTATIKGVLSQGRVEVLDAVGRCHVVDVDSNVFYPKGVSVVVQNGRVVGGAVAPKIKHVKL